MYLPQTVEYALRAMTHLSACGPGEGMRAKDLAQATGIPVHYLSKVLRRLVVKKLLTSQKGHGGGFVLARAPEEIRFLDIMNATDFELKPDHCAFGWGSCSVAKPCPLHPAWSRLSTALIDWATETTLQTVQPAKNHAKRS